MCGLNMKVIIYCLNMKVIVLEMTKLVNPSLSINKD